MAGKAQFHGSSAEKRDLESVLNRNCTCEYPRCTVHEMFNEEQRALDGLLFVRRALRPRLLASEFS